jgi:hypothetical protein
MESTEAKPCEVIILPTDGPLVRFAIDELRRVGLHEADADYGGALAKAVVDVMRAFSRAGHSGYSAHRTLELVERLARWKPLGPLTDDPAEWIDRTEISGGVPTWQSSRSPACFSNDGGKTYYDLDEPRATWRVLFSVGRRTHPTVPARKAVAP